MVSIAAAVPPSSTASTARTENQFYTSTAGFNGVYYYSSVATSANLQNFTSQILSTSFTVTAVDVVRRHPLRRWRRQASPAGTAADVFQIGTTGILPIAASTFTQLPGLPLNTTTQADPIFFPVDLYLTHVNTAGARCRAQHALCHGRWQEFRPRDGHQVVARQWGLGRKRSDPCIPTQARSLDSIIETGSTTAAFL